MARIIKVDFSQDESQFQSLLEECKLSAREKKQIQLVSWEDHDVHISLPAEWKGRTEALYTLRDRLFAASEKLGIDIRFFPTTFRKDTSGALKVCDMPEEVLDGWLGDLYRERMSEFCRAYGWLALVGAASALVPPMKKEYARTNIFGAQVGPVHTGKSVSRDYAFKLLGLDKKFIIDKMVGSAEGLINSGLDVDGETRIYNPDELSHMMAKAGLERASFPTVLCRIYDETKFSMVIRQQKEIEFNCRLSVVGGIVEDNFDQSFNQSTTMGLYDRFIYGLCPTGYEYSYRPFVGKKSDYGEPVQVEIEAKVWAELDAWKKHDGLEARAVQNALRVALICASFDGREVLKVKDLNPAQHFARYQTKIREYLSPNEGVNLDAQIRVALLKKLDMKKGQWVKRRDLTQSVNVGRYGPAVWRVLDLLILNDELEKATKQNSKRRDVIYVRRKSKND
jgi:hypothetical protein